MPRPTCATSIRFSLYPSLRNKSEEHVQTGKKVVKGKVGLIRVDDVDSLVPAGIVDEMVEETFTVGSDIEGSKEKDVRPIRLRKCQPEGIDFGGSPSADRSQAP